MSRHGIPAKDSKYQVVVGWDAPMRTYFAHVRDLNTGRRDPTLILWLGGTSDEIQSVSLLSTKLQDYATISDSMVETLWEDKRLRRM